MKDFQENIIPAAGQNDGHYFEHPGNGIRVLFVGNSITKHAPKPSAGWNNDCGMAASSIDKDYVHLTVEKIRKYDPAVSFSILQVADFERGFGNDFDTASFVKEAADYKADIIIMFFGANVSKDYDKEEDPKVKFGDEYEKLRDLIAAKPGCAVFHSQGFYIRDKLNAEKKSVAEKCGDTYITIDEIIATPDSRGAFNHPGDLGMQMISDRFWEFIEPEVKRLCGIKNRT